MELAEKELKAELEKNQSRVSSERKKDSMEKDKVDLNPSPSKNILIMELEEKKNELVSDRPLHLIGAIIRKFDDVIFLILGHV